MPTDGLGRSPTPRSVARWLPPPPEQTAVVEFISVLLQDLVRVYYTLPVPILPCTTMVEHYTRTACTLRLFRPPVLFGTLILTRPCGRSSLFYRTCPLRSCG